MKTTEDPEELVNFSPSTEQTIGFHSTSRAAGDQIEKYGFLPDKIFPEPDHVRLIGLGKAHKLDTFALESWLAMRSVTFTIHAEDAIKHVEHGKAGGQGLKNVTQLLEQLPGSINSHDQAFVQEIQTRIQLIRSDQPITYVVDLTDLGPRLSKDSLQPYYYYRWDPSLALPELSEIAPTRILMKLVHKQS